MNEILSWHSIKDFFKGQWIELVDCQWHRNKPFPIRARVRHHAWDRAELMQAIEASGQGANSTILYIGVTDSIIDHSNVAVL